MNKIYDEIDSINKKYENIINKLKWALYISITLNFFFLFFK